MNNVVKHLTRLEVNVLKNKNKLLKSKVKVLKEENRLLHEQLMDLQATIRKLKKKWLTPWV